MPIRLDEHDPTLDLKPGTAKSDIIAFLYSNTELGFKPKEIEDHLDIPHTTVTTTLTRLHDQGLIGKTSDSHYHGLEHRETLHRYVASLDQLEKMFESMDKDEEHTDIEGSPVKHIDESELEVELAQLEAEMNLE
ncbi:MarR family transcriptional regulator [Halosolutus gelatinilyticus]|uniref:MarR family transcriptional regulator n=1 Tax=Halosolutus gelatinilyticus TaxID=2931975 RepID=UPI001FF4189C|nr:MarR family transcriptional regulator [Halosolutus gelatinilyticus]